MADPDPLAPFFSSPIDSFFRNVLDNLYDGIYITDRDRRIIYWNKAAEKLTGYEAEEVLGKNCSRNILVHVDEFGRSLCTGQCPLGRTMLDRRPRQEEVYLRHKQGHRVPVSIRTCPLPGPDGEIVGGVEIFSDNSRQRQAQERFRDMEKLAFLDPVSRVGNRRYVEEKLRQFMKRYHKHQILFGILLADLDRFKHINDTYGHLVGDIVLRNVAQSLSGSLRSSDCLGRWGGDEFLAILPGVTGDGLPDAIRRCRAQVAQSQVIVDGKDLPVTVSIGAAVVEPGDTLESLVTRADQRMYAEKKTNPEIRGGPMLF